MIIKSTLSKNLNSTKVTTGIQRLRKDVKEGLQKEVFLYNVSGNLCKQKKTGYPVRYIH